MPEGYYFWWGVQFNTNYEFVSPDFELYRSTDYSCPQYLRNPPSSPYGNNEFSGGITDILKSYQESRSVNPETDQPLRDTYMLTGGTLHYQREICYVIIVCTGHDLEVQSQITASDICSEPVVNFNGLVDENLKVIDYTKIPQLQLSFRFLSSKER